MTISFVYLTALVSASGGFFSLNFHTKMFVFLRVRSTIVVKNGTTFVTAPNGGEELMDRGGKEYSGA